MQVQREAKNALMLGEQKDGQYFVQTESLNSYFCFWLNIFFHLKNFLLVFSFREYSKPKHVSAFAPSRVGSKPQRLVYWSIFTTHLNDFSILSI